MMPVTVKALEGQSILLATLTGVITVNCILEMYQLCNELTEGYDGKIYRITDAHKAESTFAEMLGVMKASSSGQASSAADPRITVVFVGTTKWITFAQKTMRQPQFGKIELPAFLTIEEALDWIHQQIDSYSKPSL